jgi:hypothetical protein
MGIARTYILALAAVLIAGCGGGTPEPEAFSPQVMKAAAPQAANTVTGGSRRTAAEYGGKRVPEPVPRS